MKPTIRFYSKINRRHTTFIALILISFTITIVSCKKLTEVDAPTTSPVTSTVYSDNATAASAVAGIYETMQENADFFSYGYGALTSFSTIGGLSADEFKIYGNIDAPLPDVYTNTLTANDVSSNGYFQIWGALYKFIYLSNSMIDALSKPNGVTPSLKKQMIGEAQFNRAFCYFYLVNLYGDVPLVLSSNYTLNVNIARTNSTAVYQQILTDLKSSQNLLSNSFVAPNGSITTERTLPNKGAATALLARVYLYMGNHWSDAETQADSVINNSATYSLVNDLSQVFLANSSEAIWQLQPVIFGFNTGYGETYVLPHVPEYGNPLALTNNLINSFEKGDHRRTSWIDSLIANGETYYYPYKYKLGYTNAAPAEYEMVLRLSEQYLIRAEARLEQNNINGALADLNMIRNRAGLLNYSGPTDQASILAAILHERQVELFTELGQRWLDLKRTKTIDAVMTIVTPEKGNNSWISNQQLYPIPKTDIQTDPSLKQNPGY